MFSVRKRTAAEKVQELTYRSLYLGEIDWIQDAVPNEYTVDTLCRLDLLN